MTLCVLGILRNFHRIGLCVCVTQTHVAFQTGGIYALWQIKFIHQYLRIGCNVMCNNNIVPINHENVRKHQMTHTIK